MEQRDALVRRYGLLPEPKLARDNTALLVVDMQYYDAHPDYGSVSRLRDRHGAEAVAYYLECLPPVIANIRRLLAGFRQQGMEVIYTRIASLTKDGRDRGRGHKNHGIHCPPGSKEARILEELAPAADEIVFSKTCSSVFNGTIIDYVLRNIGICNLVVTGVVTSGCVELAVRDASDLGYDVVVVEDATATWTAAMQEESIGAMAEISAKVVGTGEMIDRLLSI